MQIQNGKLYDNRTWRYLFPCLKSYGEEFTNYLKTFFKLGVGLGDVNFEEKTDGKSIFILFETDFAFPLHKDTIKYKEDFARFLLWLRNQPFYIEDYIYDKNQHMIVVKIPEEYFDTVKYFKKGKYSKMYTDKEIQKYFKYVTLSNKQAEVEVNNRFKKTRGILKKEKEYLEDFVKEVNNKFGTEVTSLEMKDAELDFPPNPEEEVFNYKKKRIEV